MHIETKPLSSITPYARNPRKNAGLPVSKVKASLKEFGWQQPIVIDTDGVIIAGHTRYLAAMELGMKEVPVHIATGLTPAQVKAYRLADNRTGQEATWDMELLALEFDDLKGMDFDLTLTGFDADELAGIELGEEPKDDGNYSRKIEAPIYEPTNAKPDIPALYDEAKTHELKQAIAAAELPDDLRYFLNIAADRHTVFNFAKIADYYAHSIPDVQLLMEQSALIIIDFQQAIEYGFVKLSEAVAEQYAKDYPDEE